MSFWSGNSNTKNADVLLHDEEIEEHDANATLQAPFDLDLTLGEGVSVTTQEPRAADEAFISQLQKQIAAMPKPSWVWHALQTAFAQQQSMRKIGQIIAQDTMLTAEILRVANAPAFGMLKSIADVARAVSQMGSNLVRSTATRHCMDGALNHSHGFYNQKELWRHAMAVSALAELVAKHVPNCNPHEAATLGLLHDMGRMLLNQTLKTSTMAPSNSLLEPKGYMHWEAMMAGCTHVEAGVLLAINWELPGTIVQGIRFHHHPAYAPAENVPEAIRNEVFAVYIADLIAIQMKFPGGSPCKSLPHPSYASLLPKTSLQEICNSEAVSKALWQVYATDI